MDLHFGGARLPQDLRILTKLLTFAHSNALLDRWTRRAAGLPYR